MAQVSVFEQLRSAETNSLHDLHDEICRMGIESATDFPQIVVFGLQNAGKSSVLEAISQIHFPVEPETCTRFATEIIMSRGPERRTKVSVVFASATQPTKTLPQTRCRKQDLPAVIEEARKVMNISVTDLKFSNDVLRVEIEGPNLRPLRLVDLPGLFSSEVPAQSQRDALVVNRIIEGYLSRENNIILLVVAANLCLEEQAALHKVKSYDPNGTRTIGVITHPDRVVANDREIFHRLARNELFFRQLKLGWHVLYNKADIDKTKRCHYVQRDECESMFFDRSKWSVVPKGSRGVSMLRQKLKHALYQHTQMSMQAMVADLEMNLFARQRDLAGLGPSRPNPQDIRSFLVVKASEYQMLSRDALLGHYTGPFFRDRGDEVRLRAQLQRYNAAFDCVLKTKGATHTVVEHPSFFQSPAFVPSHLRDLLQSYPYNVEEPQVVTRDSLSARLSTTDAILRIIVDPFFEKCEMLLADKIAELVEPYEEGYAIPSDEEFLVSMLDKKKEVAKKKASAPSVTDISVPLFAAGAKSKSKGTAVASLNPKFGFDPSLVIVKMETYYELSCRTFTDNVINLALERCLVRRLSSMFTPAAVSNMTDAEVIALASESVAAQNRRKDLEKEIEIFEAAVKHCRKYRFGRPNSAGSEQIQERKALRISQVSQVCPKLLLPSTTPASPTLPDKETSLPLQDDSDGSNKSNTTGTSNSGTSNSESSNSDRTNSDTDAAETVADDEEHSSIACEYNLPKVAKSSTGAQGGKAKSSPRAAEPDSKKTPKSIFSTYDPNLFKSSNRSGRIPFSFKSTPVSKSDEVRPTTKPDDVKPDETAS